MVTLKQANKELRPLSKKELQKKIQEDHDLLIKHVDTRRRQAGLGKEYIKGLTERFATKYGYIFYKKYWCLACIDEKKKAIIIPAIVKKHIYNPKKHAKKSDPGFTR